ncbi:glycosyltransferase family 2 protein [Neosynechococcus sphagnicola]|uniref:glycosyltransferase family 2 protein n=1 Tax=Neosynechococcus sphagnicola TaxID=1501145 RepID=UPI000691067F|nr:glycosyltransferase family 2 protein [Neosynechococcus sphagnicola]
MTDKAAVFLLLPVHNRRVVTLRCLETLAQNGDLEHYQVVVVDDGSSDGTQEAIQAHYPGVTILKGDGNLWWTGAMKWGMEYAYAQGAAYLIWLNDDCLPAPGAIAHLISFLQTNPQTLVAPTCYAQPSGTVVENGFRGRQRFYAHPHQQVRVDGMAGYCVGLPRSVIEQIGFPDPQRFPHYGGDDMYLLKATRHGFRAYLLGNARVNLADMEGLIHDFSSYVHNRMRSPLTFQKIFCHKKSRYYLPSQFFYYLEKYHGLPGVVVFILKLLSWLGQTCRLMLKNSSLFSGTLNNYAHPTRS